MRVNSRGVLSRGIFVRIPYNCAPTQDFQPWYTSQFVRLVCAGVGYSQLTSRVQVATRLPTMFAATQRRLPLSNDVTLLSRITAYNNISTVIINKREQDTFSGITLCVLYTVSLTTVAANWLHLVLFSADGTLLLWAPVYDSNRNS